MLSFLQKIIQDIKNKKNGGGALYIDDIKVRVGFVIPKKCSQWHKRTDKQADMVNYRLNWLMGQFSESL